jgi:hypothetical protein
MAKGKLIDDFKTLVGPQCYESFLGLLKEIGPDSRTERISVVIAGLLRFALNKAYDNQVEGSLSEALVVLEEDPHTDDEKYSDMVLDLIDEICNETNTRNFRTTARGMDYSVASQALSEYCRWYNMPWEE